MLPRPRPPPSGCQRAAPTVSNAAPALGRQGARRGSEAVALLRDTAKAPSPAAALKVPVPAPKGQARAEGHAARALRDATTARNPPRGGRGIEGVGGKSPSESPGLSLTLDVSGSPDP